ncbi:MAG: integration host factor subunit beta [Phycisphaeraceae bacterium]|nr:MAG: integration host factor subunit beta [Phycisphaeraceae bacterium]
MPTITKKDLIDRIAEDTNQKRTVIKETIQSLLKHMIIELGEGNRLEFRDFGVFEIKERAPRVAQNPKTLERVDVPAKKTVKFKVGRLMKEAVDDPEHVIPILREQAEPDTTVVVTTNGRHTAARK